MSFLSVPSSKNLVLNPSAEVNATDGVATHVTGGSVVVTRSAEAAWVGDYSFKVVTSGVGTKTIRWLTGIDTIDDEFPELVAVGEIRAKGAVGLIVPVTLIVSYWSDTFGGEEALPDPYLWEMTGGWDTLEIPPVEFERLPPEWRVQAVSIVYVTDDNQTIYFDGAHISDSEIDFYVDGDQGTEYDWEATPHNSVSRRGTVQLLVGPEEEIEGSALVSYRVEVHDINNVFIRDITPYVIEGSIEANIYADSKLSCRFEVREGGLVDDWVEWIAPYIKTEFPDGRVIESQCGLFVSITPNEVVTGIGTTYEIEGRDLPWLMSLRNPNLNFSIPKSKRRDTAIRDMFATQGVTNLAIPNIDDALDDVYRPTSESGRSYSEIINDLLDDVAHYNWWSDIEGVPTTMPYVDYATSPVARVWKNGDAVFEPFTNESITTTLANHIVVIKDDPQAPIRVEVFNTDVSSPMHESRVGRITREIANSDVKNSAAALALANQYKQEWGNIQRNATMQTFVEPGHDLHEIYGFEFVDDEGDPVPSMYGRYLVKGWRIDIGRTVEMVHSLFRTEDY